MAVTLPTLDLERFSSRPGDALGGRFTAGIAGQAVRRMWIHYLELRRWSSRLSLIGPGTADDVVERHYAESLAALSLLERRGRLIDFGSGAGFPGWILAAARPDLDVWLVESRLKKALFLEAVTRKAELSCRVVNARVGPSLSEGFPRSIDVVTVRAVRLEIGVWASLGSRLVEGGKILRWVGPSAPPPPPGFCVGRRVVISGSERVIEELVREKQDGGS